MSKHKLKDFSGYSVESIIQDFDDEYDLKEIVLLGEKVGVRRIIMEDTINSQERENTGVEIEGYPKGFFARPVSSVSHNLGSPDTFPSKSVPTANDVINHPENYSEEEIKNTINKDESKESQIGDELNKDYAKTKQNEVEEKK